MTSTDYAHIADLYDVYVNTTFDIPYWLKLEGLSAEEANSLLKSENGIRERVKIEGNYRNKQVS